MEGEDTDGVEEGGVLTEFRQFILRGNLVDLAVAVVIGTAFTALVNATRACPECLSDIPVGARPCAFCTSVVAAAA